MHEFLAENEIYISTLKYLPQVLNPPGYGTCFRVNRESRVDFLSSEADKTCNIKQNTVHERFIKVFYEVMFPLNINFIVVDGEFKPSLYIYDITRRGYAVDVVMVPA